MKAFLRILLRERAVLDPPQPNKLLFPDLRTGPEGTALLENLGFMRREVLKHLSSSFGLTCFPATERTWGREGRGIELLCLGTTDVWAG